MLRSSFLIITISTGASVQQSGGYTKGAGHTHSNGGGWVADSAKVDDSSLHKDICGVHHLFCMMKHCPCGKRSLCKAFPALRKL